MTPLVLFELFVTTLLLFEQRQKEKKREREKKRKKNCSLADSLQDPMA